MKLSKLLYQKRTISDLSEGQLSNIDKQRDS